MSEDFRIQRYDDEVEFTIKCRMRARWAPHFQSALRYMQQLGDMGSTRMVAIYSDGDGDFRPQFLFDGEREPKVLVDALSDKNGDRVYDPG